MTGSQSVACVVFCWPKLLFSQMFLPPLCVLSPYKISWKWTKCTTWLHCAIAATPRPPPPTISWSSASYRLWWWLWVRLLQGRSKTAFRLSTHKSSQLVIFLNRLLWCSHDDSDDDYVARLPFHPRYLSTLFRSVTILCGFSLKFYAFLGFFNIFFLLHHSSSVSLRGGGAVAVLLLAIHRPHRPLRWEVGNGRMRCTPIGS